MGKLRDYIETAAEAAGSLTTLASIIGVTQPRLSRMKSGKEHMPMRAAISLADTLETDRLKVIIAAEAEAAANDEEYNYWTGLLEEIEEENKNPATPLSYIRHMMN